MRVLWLTLAVVVVDQLTKVWVKLTLGAPGALVQSVPVVGDVFKLTYTENPGMAFGLSLGSKLFLTLFSIVATALIALYLWHVRGGPHGYRVALALILGGALGNILDRARFGYVVDFADLHFGDFRPFLVFNVADAAISIGVVILLLRAFLMRNERPKENVEHA